MTDFTDAVPWPTAKASGASGLNARLRKHEEATDE